MIEYKKSIFTFIDLLGFGSLVEKEPNPDKIERILSSLTESYKPADETAKMYEIKFLTFSDSTIRSLHINSDTNIQCRSGILYHEILSLVFAQANMAAKGYFVRGGLTIGDIHIDGQTVFGPAIVKAYRIESEFAVYPRIVIDPVVFDEFERSELLRNDDHNINQERESISELVRRDSDGLYFVDYLKAILPNLGEHEEQGYLLEHKTQILKSAKDHAGLNKVAAKLLWLATYHNTIVNELEDIFFSEHETHREYFLINQTEMPLVYTLGTEEGGRI